MQVPDDAGTDECARTKDRCEDKADNSKDHDSVDDEVGRVDNGPAGGGIVRKLIG